MQFPFPIVWWRSEHKAGCCWWGLPGPWGEIRTDDAMGIGAKGSHRPCWDPLDVCTITSPHAEAFLLRTPLWKLTLQCTYFPTNWDIFPLSPSPCSAVSANRHTQAAKPSTGGKKCVNICKKYMYSPFLSRLETEACILLQCLVWGLVASCPQPCCPSLALIMLC